MRDVIRPIEPTRIGQLTSALRQKHLEHLAPRRLLFTYLFITSIRSYKGTKPSERKIKTSRTPDQLSGQYMDRTCGSLKGRGKNNGRRYSDSFGVRPTLYCHGMSWRRLGHEQVSIFSLSERSGTNSSTPKEWKAWLAWLGNPNQVPAIECTRVQAPHPTVLHASATEVERPTIV